MQGALEKIEVLMHLGERFPGKLEIALFYGERRAAVFAGSVQLSNAGSGRGWLLARGLALLNRLLVDGILNSIHLDQGFGFFLKHCEVKIACLFVLLLFLRIQRNKLAPAFLTLLVASAPLNWHKLRRL
jgi:hypothetical protein